MFQWISFRSYIVVMPFTPGPNNIMAMNNARNVGFRNGLGFCFGRFFGRIIVDCGVYGLFNHIDNIAIRK